MGNDYLNDDINLDKRIIERALDSANLFLKYDGTCEGNLRSIAEKLGVSRQTTYNDMISVLPKIDRDLADKVKKILDNNKKERSYRSWKNKRKREDDR